MQFQSWDNEEGRTTANLSSIYTSTTFYNNIRFIIKDYLSGFNFISMVIKTNSFRTQPQPPWHIGFVLQKTKLNNSSKIDVYSTEKVCHWKYAIVQTLLIPIPMWIHLWGWELRAMFSNNTAWCNASFSQPQELKFEIFSERCSKCLKL